MLVTTFRISCRILLCLDRLWQAAHGTCPVCVYLLIALLLTFINVIRQGCRLLTIMVLWTKGEVPSVPLNLDGETPPFLVATTTLPTWLMTCRRAFLIYLLMLLARS